MEYRTNSTNQMRNNEFMRYVGYEDTISIQQFFSNDTVRKISNKITQLLMGVDKHNRPIIVPNQTIFSIMSAVLDNYRPETGDIHSRYNIPKRGTVGVQSMIDQVINIITTDVKNNIGMEECNRNLSIWTTVLGDFNEHGLRSHSKIKLREKRPMPMAFNMNY